MGLSPKELDYVVIGQTDANMLSLGFKPVGVYFPVYLHPQSKQEYALARTEQKNGNGYTGFSVDASVSVTLEEDLARRDLTINSIALDDEGRLIDPFNGQKDIENKILRHTTDAFCDDPVRVLRLARFMARFGDDWSIHPDTLVLIKKMHANGELEHLVPEKIWQETLQALGEKHPQLFFETLDGLGIFPELEEMKVIPQPPNHHPEGDVFVHTMLVLKRAADLGFDVETRFAAMTHDFGKATSYHSTGHLKGHEQVGMALIEKFCDRLRVPNKFRELAVITSDNHTRCHTIKVMKPKSLQKFMIQRLDCLSHPLRFKQFLQACACDAQGRGDTLVDKPYHQASYAIDLFEALSSLNRKVIAKVAISNGVRGEDIGEAIRISEIQCIREYIAN